MTGPEPSEPISSVGTDQHVDADLVPPGRTLEAEQAVQHHQNAALHVGNARTVQRVGVPELGRLEMAVDREDGVVMTGHDNAHRGLRPQATMEGRREFLLTHRTVRIDHGGRRQVDGGYLATQLGEGLFQARAHALESLRIAAAGIDRGPRLDRVDHVIGPPVYPVEHCTLVGVEIGFVLHVPVIAF